jgi:predicted TIM-barrel fold metal-dependent hydrolase
LSFQNLRIIDFHAHFPLGWGRRPDTHKLLREYNRERSVRFRREWDFPEPETASATREEMAVRWAAELDAKGLDLVVFMTGGGNSSLAETVRLHPDRFAGFAHHDLAAPDALAQLKQAVEEMGLRGYKLLAPRLTVTFDEPRLRPVWEYMAERRLPLLIHFGLLGTGGGIVSHPLINPLSIFNVAHEFPEIPVIVPHFGCGYWQELLQLAWSCPNVYVDTSGSNQWMRWMPYELTLESAFRKAYETIGPERILFGTDSSWFPRGFAYRYLQDQVRICRWLAMKEEDIQAIFGRNAARLLGLTWPVRNAVPPGGRE